MDSGSWEALYVSINYTHYLQEYTRAGQSSRYSGSGHFFFVEMYHTIPPSNAVPQNCGRTVASFKNWFQKIKGDQPLRKTKRFVKPFAV